VSLTAGGVVLALSLERLLSVDTGFTARGVVAARVSAYAERYPDIKRVRQFFDSVGDSLRALPTVETAAVGSSLPLSGQASGTSVLAEGQPAPPAGRPSAGWQTVTPGYFRALGIPLRAGRDFSAADIDRKDHVVIVNEQLARLLFGGADPVGRRIAVGGGDAAGDWHHVIGVVGDVRHQALDAAPAPRVYDFFGQHWSRTMFVVVRARTDDPAPLFADIRRTVAALDPEAPVFEAASLPALVARSASARRLAAILAAGLAGTAVLLAILGVAAVAAAAVAERRREIGVRAALGASPRDLLRMVLGEGLRTGAAGALAGLAGSWAAVRLLGAHLFGLDLGDVTLSVAGVAAVLLGVAVTAALPAARRAARADPLVAMRP
jgi:predicted permease